MDFSNLSAYLSSLRSRFDVRGFDLIVMQKHKCLFRQSEGFCDRAQSRPVSPDDLYDVYSCTKVLTMAAVLKLMEEGLLSPEDELGLYLPEYKEMYVAEGFDYNPAEGIWPPAGTPVRPAARPIKIRHLMTMTAGLSYDLEHPAIREAAARGGGNASTREIVRAMAKMPLLFDPGDDWLYSLAHDVLAAVVETISGMSFGAFLKKNFFAPLGMEDSYMKEADIPKERLSAMYALDPADPRQEKLIPVSSENAFRFSRQYESGGAGLCCTAGDYALFADALACGGEGLSGASVLKPETVALLKEDRLTPRQRRRFQTVENPDYSYGYGVRTLYNLKASKSSPGEFGWCGAAGAYTLIDMKKKLSIFYVHHILYYRRFQDSAHPAIRDLVYEALEA